MDPNSNLNKNNSSGQSMPEIYKQIFNQTVNTKFKNPAAPFKNRWASNNSETTVKGDDPLS